jgi:hypothetical protein
MPSTRPFRKYGQIFDDEGAPEKPPEPESPYESLPYVAPEKRPSAVEAEQAELEDLRGTTQNHYD